MKAYILLAHKNPDQVKRLVTTLDDGNSIFFIHIDAKSNMAEFVSLLENNGNVEFATNRNLNIWGGFSLLYTHVLMMKLVKSRNIDFTHLIFLSGQDFPIKNNEFINDFLNRNKEKSFVESFPLPNKGWGRYGGLERYEKVHLRYINVPPVIKKMQRLCDLLFDLGIKGKCLCGCNRKGGVTGIF